MKRMIAGFIIFGVGIWRIIETFRTYEGLVDKWRISQAIVQGQIIQEPEVGTAFWGEAAFWLITLVIGGLLFYCGYRSTKRITGRKETKRLKATRKVPSS